jgi:sporulenol synthase
MKNVIESELTRLVAQLKDKQSKDGSWRFCFESSSMTDAYMIILLRSLRIHDEELIKSLVKRIEVRQSDHGAWKLYEDEAEGNISATVEAYYALLYSGYKQKGDKEMEKAKQFIISQGGLAKVSSLTKFMLGMTGQYPWPRYFPVPIEILLLPQTFLINFFDFVGYARVHMAPILIIADKKFSVKWNNTPDLSELLNIRGLEGESFEELRSYEARSFLSLLKHSVKKIIGLPSDLHRLAIEQAKRYMLNRIEPDGTLYSYFSATFLMIFALLSLGYSENDPVIKKAVKGLKALVCHIDGHAHIQNSTSTVWDTALISHALQTSGMDITSQTIHKASQYLLQRQHYKYGDWFIHNLSTLPGGWGFSDINTINPDVDDTTSALRALRKIANQSPTLRQSWYRGTSWVLSMQNDDGGWPAFEKNTNKKILKLIPIDGSESASIDPSTADLTGRTLEFLGKEANLNLYHPQIKSGVEWLEDNQKEDGSWYGRWGIFYIYGTWAAITGMSAVGINKENTSVQKGIHWLEKIQNDDGGWGESCKSDIEKRYISLGSSTPSQTSWALDALISFYDNPTDKINRGVECLIKKLNDHDWTYVYPTGAGLPGGFYFNYHSYNYIWPLLTLSHYMEKYS